MVAVDCGTPRSLCQDSFILAMRSSMVSALMTWRETCPAHCQRNSSILGLLRPARKDGLQGNKNETHYQTTSLDPGDRRRRPERSGHQTINKLDSMTLNSYPGPRMLGG